MLNSNYIIQQQLDNCFSRLEYAVCQLTEIRDLFHEDTQSQLKEIRNSVSKQFGKITPTSQSNLISNQLDWMLNNSSDYKFYPITIRPYESFIKGKPFNLRKEIVIKLVNELVIKFDAHLIKQPKKQPHLRIIHHTYIENQTKYGSTDIEHAHGVWGIHKSLVDKWETNDFIQSVLEKGSFIFGKYKYSLNDVVHSINVGEFDLESDITSKENPAGWIKYSTKWNSSEGFYSLT